MLTIFSMQCNKFCYSELYSYISQLNYKEIRKVQMLSNFLLI